ncbi:MULTISPECIES: hypothetical protein [unclassified Micromonospora]|uniref:hypothetical protein n=1 Tax=unclassified Micromonospora TaxID=2617518 RepID=UPI003630A3C9
MRRRWMAAGAALVVLGTLAVGPPAGAASPPEQHCVVDVATEEMDCYDSFRKATAAASGGRITDAPDDAQAAAADPGFRRLLSGGGRKLDGVGAAQEGFVAQADIVIGVMYEDDNYAGSTLTYRAPSGCTGPITDVDWLVELITPDSWNDEIGSFLAGGGACWVSLFEHRSWLGASTPFASLDDELGVLDDEASSIRWS